MGKQDAAMQSYLSDKRRFADLFNGVFFQGKQLINYCELQESSERYSDMEDQGRTRFRDIKMTMKSGELFRLLAVENQTTVDYSMPYRCMQYDSMEYGKQLKALKNFNRNYNLTATPAERLCGMKKSDRLTPVYTLCLYHGDEPWDGPSSLKDMMDFGKTENEMSRYFADYPLRLFCVNEAPDFNIFHTELRELFCAIKYRKDKKGLLQLFQRNSRYRSLGQETVQTLSVLLNIPDLWQKKEKYWRIKDNKEGYDMCQALEEWRQDNIAEGITQGKTVIVKNMLKRGFPDEVICELAECTVEFIDPLR